MTYDPLAPNGPDESNMGDDDEFTVEVAKEDDDNNKSLLPNGVYAAVLTSIEKKDSKAGNKQYVWTFNVKGKRTDGSTKTISVKEYTGLDADAAWKLRKMAACFGIPLTVKDGKEYVHFTRQDVIGKRIQVTLEKEEFNSRWSSKIKKTEPHPQGPTVPLEAAL